MRRYIYIHGCPDDVDMTVPGSHGCIRMRNDDVIDLFDRVEAGTTVVIETPTPGTNTPVESIACAPKC